MNQTEVFGRDEGDNWFLRNRAALEAVKRDRAIDMALRWNQRQPLRSVCELGCANGWRLAVLGESLPTVDRLSGADLSIAAIEDGRARWPTLNLTVGSLDRPVIAGTFDLVIVCFVLHWVSRDRLAASVSGIDALVRDGGALIVADFLPDRPCARKYHHRSDVEIYTFKQDYTRCFTGLGFYGEIEREIFAHSGSPNAEIDPQERSICALLRKDMSSYQSA